MPVTACQIDGQPGFKWGDAGKCYSYAPDSDTSRERARGLAARQGRAIEVNPDTDKMAVQIFRNRLSQVHRRVLIIEGKQPCNKCGETNESKLQVDHIKPKVEGGGDNASNLQVLCSACHASKTARQVERVRSSSTSKARHSRLRCMSCDKPPEVEVLWAEGRARAWFCKDDLAIWKSEGDGWHDVGAERELKWDVASSGRWSEGAPTKAESELALSKAADQDVVDKGFYAQITKAEESERRYTFAVVYKATTDIDNPEEDAHNEFVTDVELQEALWDHVRRGDRRVYVQHGLIEGIGFKEAGEWVELSTFPFEVEVEFILPGQPTQKRIIPAGSAWMGVVWLEWSWKLVKSGEIRGLSFGGTARSTEV